MTTNSDTVSRLEAAKKQLEDQTATASGATLLQLLTAIQHIADEVGSIEAQMLANANYVPLTNPFKEASADAHAFIATLDRLKSSFGALSTVAQAADTVIGIIRAV